MKKHNFSAGPAILPKSVMAKAAESCIEFNGIGMSILEISHRSKPFEAVMTEALSLSKELVGAGDDFESMFISGGASSQFFMAPMNLLNEDETAAYTNTGTWADNAIKEGKVFGNINVVASSKDSNYNFIPKGFDIPSDSKYLHLTSNNTIFGTQIQTWPDTNVPIVCDMSSDIFSRPLPIERFGMIYAGAQKNMGPAGTTLVLVRKDMLGKVSRKLPSMLDYRVHIKGGSMYNTPPAFPIYVSLLTMQWIKEQGGVAAMQIKNEDKASILYNEIDANPLFRGSTAVEDRSRMNVCFLAAHDEAETMLSDLAKANGVDGIKGHRSVGGFRASIYNAMEKESVQVLVDLMREVGAKLG